MRYADCLRELNATIEQEKRFCVVVDLVRGGALLPDIEAECNEKMQLDIFGPPSARREVIIWHRVKAVRPRHRTTPPSVHADLAPTHFQNLSLSIQPSPPL